MTRISNSDQIILLLRSHLERRVRNKKVEVNRSAAARKATAEPNAVMRAREILADTEIDEQKFAEVVIASLLQDEFGPRFASDPQFSAMVKDVSRTILEMPAGKELMSQAIGQLLNASS